MAKESKKRSLKPLINRGDFLRSINIDFDADEPERIAHYYPTEKSTGLLRKILSLDHERSLLVAAPYGSGKSMIATYALHSVENRKEAREYLKNINERLERIDRSLHGWQSERIQKWSRQGLVIAINGFSEDVCRQLLSAACLSFERIGKETSTEPLHKLLRTDSIGLLDCLDTLKQCVVSAKLDRVLILWDEFGRHLETLVAEGKSAELNNLQTLSEFSARQKSIPWSLSLFLHQGFLNYASSLPNSLRREWKKIEGRFLSVDYVEDSREIYRLIGEIVSAQRGASIKMAKSNLVDKAKELIGVGRFEGFKPKQLAELLERTFPLSPTVVELLPRISARVSQNERTLFNFLFDLDYKERSIGAGVLFDYFSDQMQADVDVGGTHRQWLETQSALSKVSGDKELELVLKTTCLLGLGLSGERNRATKSQVAIAVAGWGDVATAEDLLNELIKRKLLLHRKHSDEVSVWHGTDLDLRGRLLQAKLDREAGFDLVSFLTKEALPPTWKPQDYNDEYSVHRFFKSVYATIEELSNQESFFRSDVTIPKPEEDGRIVYLIPQTAEDVQRAKEFLEQLDLNKSFESDGLNRVVFALPEAPLPLCDAALEVHCLLEMEMDKELTSEDPLILPEIQQMLDDARSHLQNLIDHLTVPKPEKPVLWYYQAQPSYICSPRVLRRFLSDRMRKAFPLTPKIRNELVVRRKPSPVVVNARKKLLMGMLERNGQSLFGIEGNFPDASMCRTVLVKTGLYRFDHKAKRWGFVSPKAIDDLGLRKVWELVENFFTEPDHEGKNPKDLFDRLTAPPYGVRPGLFPILFTAGLKAFAYTTSLARDNVYIADILPGEIEQLCKEPERYLLKVYTLEPNVVEYLECLKTLFSTQQYQSEEQDLVRITFESLKAWIRHLPAASMNSQNLSSKARHFRSEILENPDPYFLLVADIPASLGLSLDDDGFNKIIDSAKVVKAEIEGITAFYQEAALNCLKDCLNISPIDSSSVRIKVKAWADCFVGLLPSSHSGLPLLNRMRMEYKSDSKMIESIVSVVSHVSLSRWEDDHLEIYQRNLKLMIEAIERQSLRANLKTVQDKGITRHLEKLLSDQIGSSYEKLVELRGAASAKKALNLILNSLNNDLKKLTTR